MFEQQGKIGVDDHAIFSSNIDSISLKIGLQFLYASMGKDVYGDILELMPYIKGDVATTIAVASLIVEYLDIRRNATRLFLISCLGVPFYVAAVIQFLAGYNSTNWKLCKGFLKMRRKLATKPNFVVPNQTHH